MLDSDSPYNVGRKSELLDSHAHQQQLTYNARQQLSAQQTTISALKKQLEPKLSTTSVPDEVKLASRLTSAYLCERRTYFSSTKYLLQIRREQISNGTSKMCIVLQATRNENDRTVLPLQLVANVRPSQDTEENELFRIEMDPVHGQTLELFSRERDRILTEIALEQESLIQSEVASPSPQQNNDSEHNPTEGNQLLTIEGSVDQLQQAFATASTVKITTAETFQMEHRKDFFLQESEQPRKISFVVHRYGICARYQHKESTIGPTNEPILINLSSGPTTRQHSRAQTRTNVSDLSMTPSSLWIMFTDIDFVYIPRDHNSENQGQNSIMYIVKKNKEVEKFVYNSKDLVVSAINQNCSKLLGKGINLKKTTEIQRERLTDGSKHFSVDDQALIRHIWGKELGMADVSKPISNEYRMLLEVPNSGGKDKEVILRLYSDQLWIFQRLKQRGNENDAESIIFAAKVDTLTRCVLCSTSESTGELSLALALTFHLKEKDVSRGDYGRDTTRASYFKDSYRDIYLKKPKDGKEFAHHKKQMSELIALILLLREEATNDLINECADGGGITNPDDDSIDMQVILNKLQVLPLPERPLPSQTVMGSLPLSISYQEYSNEPLSSFTVDVDYEQNTFRELIKLWRLHEQQLSEQSSDLPATEDKLRRTMREICENCNYYNLRPSDDTMVETFVKKLVRLIDEYERLEANQAIQFSLDQQEEYHESELDTASEDERDGTTFENSHRAESNQTKGGADSSGQAGSGQDNLVTEKDKDQQNAAGEEESFEDQDISGSRNNESSITKAIKADDQAQRKKFNECTESLARMLLIFQRMMQSGYIFASQPLLYSNKLARSLFKLLKVENFLMTYLSSQCIVSIIQFVDSSQSSNEQRNKHLFLRDQLNMMKYLRRHLSYHDRCLKLKGKITCHMSMKICADLLRALFCNRKAPHLNVATARLRLLDQETYATRRPRQRTNGEQLIQGGGCTESISQRDMVNFIKALCDDDYKLLHIIERFSLDKHLVTSVSYGRLVTELLDFCYQVRDQPLPSDLGFRFFGQLQYRLFAYSVNILVQVETLMKGMSGDSRTLKSSHAHALCIVTMLLRQNTKAIQVMQKIFKKFLFRQVSTFSTEQMPERWGQVEWYNFFIVARNENSRRAADYWDDQMRLDCLKSIRMAIELFNQDCQSHIKPILRQESRPQMYERVLSHLTHEFSESGQLRSKVNHLKWNFGEFSITYSCEAEQLKIWHYYLKVLVVEKRDSQSVVASLHQSFDMKDAKKLWDHLLEVFVPESTKQANFEKRQLILKCLILLYRSYPERIGPVKLLPYWLRLLQDLKERSCYFLVLQLILVVLDAPPRTKEAIANAKIFEEANGLEIVVGCLNFGYKELQDSLIMSKMREIRNAESKSSNGAEHVEEFKDSEKMFVNKMHIEEEQSEAISAVISAFRDETADFNSVQQKTLIELQGEEQSMAPFQGDIENRGDGGLQDLLNKSDEDSKSLLDNHQDNSNVNDYTVMVEEADQLRVNYTKTIKNRGIFEQNSESVNLAILAFTILDFCMRQQKNSRDSPISKGKLFLLKRQNVAVIVQLLLLQNLDLLRCILKFVHFHFKSEEALRMIKDSGIIEFLILLLDNKEVSHFDSLGEDDDYAAGGATLQSRMHTHADQDRAEPNFEELPPTIADCAFNLINKIQEVWGDECNADLGDVIDQFDSNDKNVLEQNPKLKQSLLLRYLPLPMIIRSSYEQQCGCAPPGQESFLTIFQHERYEQATIIWKAKMQRKLYEEIIMHNSELLEELEAYFFNPQQARDTSLIKKTDNIPLYKGPLRERIEYQNIEKEVKCGKYYLRIWVINREKQKAQKSVQTTITIPDSEENDYLLNLKSSFSGIMERLELDKLDVEDSPHWKEIKDLTYTLKACLYAGETFKLKEFKCLEQVISLIKLVIKKYERRVLEKTKTDFQHILMLALQIIYTMINPERKDAAIGKNRKELLEKPDIIELHEQIIGLVYEKSQKKKRDDESGELGSIQTPREAVLKQFEAGILRYAVLNLDIIMQSLGRQQQSSSQQAGVGDIRKHITNSFELFLNFTKILGLPDDLYKVIEASSTDISAIRKQHQIFQPSELMMLETVMPVQQEQNVATMGSSNKKQPNRTYEKTDLHIFGLAKINAKPQEPVKNKLAFSARTTRSSASKTFSFDKVKIDLLSKVPKDDQHRQISSRKKGEEDKKGNLMDKNYPLIFDSKDVEIAFKRNKKVEMVQTELTQAALTDEKFNSVLQLTAAVFKIGLYLSKDESIVIDLIRTGFLWRVLQFIQFSMQRDLLKHYSKTEQMIDDCCLILVNIASKAAEALEDCEGAGQDHQVSETDQILLEYSQAFAKLLPKKIFETLQASRMKIGDRRFDMPDSEYRNHASKFRKLFSLEHEATPELIWESQMRDELRQVLSSQLDSILLHSKHTRDFKNDSNIYKHKIGEFKFTVDTNELKINEIFVKHFNDDIFFRPPNILDFVKALVERLRVDTSDGEFSRGFTLHSLEDMFEITKALHNLIQYQNALNTTNFKIDANITLFCKILHSSESSLQHRDEDDPVGKKIQEIKEVVLEMLVLISQDKEFATSLLNNLQFVLLVAETFNRAQLEGSLQVLLMQRLTHILLEIWEIRNKQNECEFLDEFNKFLNKDGIIIFCLKAIMNRQQDGGSRRTLTFLVQQNIMQDTETFSKVSAVFPVQFLNMRSCPQSLSEIEEEEWKRARDFLNYLDQEHFENQFVIWTAMMRNGDGNQAGLYHEITQMCNDIEGHLESMTKNQFQPFSQNNFDLDDKPTQMLTELTRRNMEHEVVVDDIILRIFNQDPTVYIQRDFGLFIQCLIMKFTELNRTLELIRQRMIGTASTVTFDVDGEAKTVTKENLGRMQKYVSNQALLVSTSLTLCIEQVTKNESNVNLKDKIGTFKKALAAQASNADLRKRAAAVPESAQGIDELDKFKKLRLLPLEHLTRCLVSEIERMTLIDRELPVELRITFLQLTSLIFAIDCSIVLTKKDDHQKIMASKTYKTKFVNFLKKLVVGVADDSETTTLEGTVTLALLASAVDFGGQRLTASLFEEDFVLQMLKKIFFQFTNLEKVTTYVMSKLARIDPKIQRDFHEEQKQTSGAQHEKWSKILHASGSSSSESSGVEWRGAANSPEEAATRYHQSTQDTNIIEEKLVPEEEKTDLNQTLSPSDLVLPLISKDAILLGKAEKILEHCETDLPMIEVIQRHAVQHIDAN